MEIKPGDRVKITLPMSDPFPDGYAIGKVISAINWGTKEKPNWYIEMKKEKVAPGWQLGYGYWKQKQDGGTIEKL